VKEFGADVAFWHRPPDAAYAAVLNEFVRLDATEADWEDRSFESALRVFQKRFAATRTEEGTIMATVLAYVIDETYSSRRGAILAEFRESDAVRQLFQQAIVDWETVRTRRDSVPASNVIDAAQ
jgi:hypothetical protein